MSQHDNVMASIITHSLIFLSTESSSIKSKKSLTRDGCMGHTLDFPSQEWGICRNIRHLHQATSYKTESSYFNPKYDLFLDLTK